MVRFCLRDPILCLAVLVERRLGTDKHTGS